MLESVSWTSNPLLELRQGIVSPLGEWFGRSSGEAVVAIVVVDLFDEAEWF